MKSAYFYRACLYNKDGSIAQLITEEFTTSRPQNAMTIAYTRAARHLLPELHQSIHVDTLREIDSVWS